MRVLVIILFLFSALFASTVCATAYKWENKDNQVEYSQVPPQTGAVTPIDAPPPPPSATQSQDSASSLIEGQQKQEIKDKREKALEQAQGEEASAMAKNCEQFKAYRDNLESKARIKLINADGSAVLLSQEQRAAEIQKAEDGIKTYCQPSGSAGANSAPAPSQNPNPSHY